MDLLHAAPENRNCDLRTKNPPNDFNKRTAKKQMGSFQPGNERTSADLSSSQNQKKKVFGEGRPYDLSSVVFSICMLMWKCNALSVYTQRWSSRRRRHSSAAVRGRTCCCTAAPHKRLLVFFLFCFSLRFEDGCVFTGGPLGLFAVCLPAVYGCRRHERLLSLRNCLTESRRPRGRRKELPSVKVMASESF